MKRKHKCRKCKGTGKIISGYYFASVAAITPTRAIKEICSACKGTGKTK